MLFSDRADAGRRLGGALAARDPPVRDPLVIALPRGGVPVGDAVARILGAQLEVLVVRKIGAPIHPEYAIGALAEGGTICLDEDAAAMVGATRQEVDEVVRRETRELERRVEAYRRGRPLPPLLDRTIVLPPTAPNRRQPPPTAANCHQPPPTGANRHQPPPTAVNRQVVDDGLATGLTAEAACRALRAAGAAHLLLAAPVASPSTVRRLQGDGAIVDEVVVLAQPPSFRAVGQFYLDFSQTTDSEVLAILEDHRRRPPTAPPPPPPPAAPAPHGPAPAPGGAAGPGRHAAAPPEPDKRRQVAPAEGPEVELLSGASGPASGDDVMRGLLPEPGPEPDYRSPAGAAAAPAAAGRRKPAVAAAGDDRGTAAKHAAAAAAAQAAGAPAGATPAAAQHQRRPPVVEREVLVSIPPGGDAAAAVSLPGTLAVPAGSAGAVLFAHGSGSGRLSPRNRQVASALNEAGVATLLFDLLTENESSNRRNVFDIPLLAGRLEGALGWLRAEGASLGLDPALPVGFFGASTGGGAALWAAADLGPAVAAVVSRGGRPDLAAGRLPRVTAPTLLLVGGRDRDVRALNEDAARAMTGCPEVEVDVIPGATHLFPEPGTLEAVASKAAAWFAQHFAACRRSPGA
ncbi:hypothetical protein MNEG_2641 [Monoraphidium neglectum]|uniref:Dienelactone hydrolase domain-containing protein n=1 Tax=Monoraphidium neglectum TaxID=145388 RepID=A0A0D2K4F7_9CHLO|nr:hypothetical protein MNEG_2641 [Monoraphidium neglectum]KIZ05318.1 hypothetical protein MNEG_2641 [Monoraphidium neglectum]|eukprot:XP_013904337.1 hypothetical protein MNEG_2641 [Monoraphidium neglectum]